MQGFILRTLINIELVDGAGRSPWVYPKAERGISLGIRVHYQNPATLFCEKTSDLEACGGLSGPSFMMGKRYNCDKDPLV